VGTLIFHPSPLRFARFSKRSNLSDLEQIYEPPLMGLCPQICTVRLLISEKMAVQILPLKSGRKKLSNRNNAATHCPILLKYGRLLEHYRPRRDGRPQVAMHHWFCHLF